MKQIVLALIVIAAFLSGVTAVAAVVAFDGASFLVKADAVEVAIVAVLVGLTVVAFTVGVTLCVIGLKESRKYHAMLDYLKSLEHIDQVYAIDTEGNTVRIHDVVTDIKVYYRDSLTKPGNPILDVKYLR